ncbi:MAG TPA: dihydrodipicolinate synthase family protein [Solirubrobacteraceae bacterium]|jgi:4-hydroxy-tetrahydrodipicolinate synthase
MPTIRFPGVIPAVTTPFDDRGDVAPAALERNVAALLDDGMAGIVGAGTMGEAGSLSAAERRLVIETIAGVAGGRVPVVAGVSAGTPAQAIDYATDAAAAGADALMCLPPVLYRGDDREIEAYFAAVAGATDLPVMLYNNPEASGLDLPPELIVRIAERVENVVAVKECSGDARRIAGILAASGGELEVLVGGDDWALEGFCGGATGWVSGVAVVAPGECRSLYEHCRAGELEAARAINARLLPLARFDMTPKLVQYFKAAQDAVGRTGGPCRPPRLELADIERDALAAALRTLGVAEVAA